MKLNVITQLHMSSKRDYAARMSADKATCIEVARKYDSEYWDGERRYGYGGYRYDGRWKSVAASLINKYGLSNCSSILDLGCGKAHLLWELKGILPNLRVVGADISEYAISKAPEEIRGSLTHMDLRNAPFPFGDGEFDLVLSIGTIHNLHIKDLFQTIQEIERIGKQKFIVVESYRNSQEQVNLQCWALTCSSFYSEEDWEWIFWNNGYTGDYEFVFFE